MKIKRSIIEFGRQFIILRACEVRDKLLKILMTFVIKSEAVEELQFV